MSLPEPNFIERDPALITREIVSWYEQKTGKKLYPAQIEHLYIDLLAYRESLVRIGIQEAAKQCLVSFAREPMLDYLGELVGAVRIDDEPATTTVRFESSLQDEGVFIPAGTRISDSKSDVIFSTIDAAMIAASQSYVDVLAVCETGGSIGNGFAVGQLDVLIDLVLDVDVKNITVSSGGFDRESDERLRERIKLAPEGFTTAGSYGAYRYHAMSASASIVDVGIKSNVPGEVSIYPITQQGLPDVGLLLKVADACSDDKVRPLCDTVKVLAPDVIEYEIKANVTLYSTADASIVKPLVEQNAQHYANQQSSGLGRDLVPSQLCAALKVPGVYDVNLDGFELHKLDDREWSKCTAISVTIIGAENG